MKIIILTVDHLYANLVVKELVSNFKTDIKLVIASGVILHNHSLTSSLIKYLQISGIYYFLTQAIKLQIYKLLSTTTKNKTNKFYSFKNLLKIQNIPLAHEGNVNNTAFLNKVEQTKPDLIVSIFFNQILSPKLIKLSKKGAINIHPAFLPDYKGVSPVFWALTNKEKYSGVSIHKIDAGIDTGSIITRSKIKVSKEDTEDSLYFKSATIGSRLLVKAINGIKKGPLKTVNNSGGRYFSLPNKIAVKKFKKNGRNFFNLKEYIFN